MNVEGAKVLITGASSGIGEALAYTLTEQGAVVGLVARRGDRLASVLARCQKHSPQSRLWIGDLGDLEWAHQVAIEAWDQFGHLDVLVNNAAVPKRRPVDQLTDGDVEETMRINFLSPVRMTLAVLPRMLARRAGWIVNVASLGGRLGIIHEAAYSASKFALTGWSESMWIDLRDTGVEVRLIHPGPIDTDIWDRPGSEAPLYQGPKEPPSIVADGIVAALESDRFEHYLPDLKWVVDSKQADLDGFLAGSAQLGKQ